MTRISTNRSQINFGHWSSLIVSNSLNQIIQVIINDKFLSWHNKKNFDPCNSYLLIPIKVNYNLNQGLQVNPEAVAWLNSVQQDKHIGIITVVGKYRTGKSYILNRVLLNQNKGFEVGPTINACTKGLWVWPELIENSNDPGTRYMVMDTEGLGSLE